MAKQNPLLKDLKTYIMFSNNQNYKDRLIEAYYIIKKNNINTYEDFKKCNLGIGAFSYYEITIFDRLKNEEYEAMLSSFYIELQNIKNLPDNYGDILASYGTIGKTSYPHKKNKR